MMMVVELSVQDEVAKETESKDNPSKEETLTPVPNSLIARPGQADSRRGKSRNSYSIAALCQISVNIGANPITGTSGNEGIPPHVSSHQVGPGT